MVEFLAAASVLLLVTSTTNRGFVTVSALSGSLSSKVQATVTSG